MSAIDSNERVRLTARIGAMRIGAFRIGFVPTETVPITGTPTSPPSGPEYQYERERPANG